MVPQKQPHTNQQYQSYVFNCKSSTLEYGYIIVYINEIWLHGNIAAIQ